MLNDFVVEKKQDFVIWW